MADNEQAPNISIEPGGKGRLVYDKARRTIVRRPPGPYDFSRFYKLMEYLQDWRNGDHEDNKVMCRSDIITIIEGVKALRG